MLRGFHKLCDKGLWDEARNLLHDRSENANTARDTASQPGGYGEWTALHIACKRDPPADVIKTLCELSETPAETFDLYNKLPIHYAAEYGANVDVMKALIECCPKCLSGVDNEGRTALHLSFKYSIQDPATLIDPMRGFPNLEEVKTLLGDDTTVLWTADENDHIPLHYAVSNIDKCSLSVIEKLVNTDINNVVAQTKGGMTPLQLAILKSTERVITVEIVQLLLGISPDGKEWIDEEFEVTRMLSSTDMLPLHFACQNFENVPFDTLQLLLERCPSAAAAAALEGGYPLQILESHRVTMKDPDELVHFNKKSDMLFAYHPNMLPFRTEENRLQRFRERIISELTGKKATLTEEAKSIWTWMCMFPEEEDTDGLYPKSISDILENIDGGSAKTLACVTISRENEEDMPLYQAVSPAINKVLAPYLRFVDRYEMNKEDFTKSGSNMVAKAYDSTYTEEDDRSNVVITFYANRTEFTQEVDINKKLQRTADLEGISSPTIKIIQTFDTDRVGTSLETGDDTRFARDVTQFNDMFANISGYSYAIVREKSGETVDMISNYNTVDRKFGIQNKKHVKDIAESILCLHKNNYVLGGMKVGDFVQLYGNTIKLRSVRNIVEIDTHSKSHTKFYGCVSDDFGISNLPPEMITKLDAEGVEKYIAYWSRVSNDFNIANELTPEEVKESEKLKNYLEDEGCTFEDFWIRVQNNAALWKRIQPRQVGGYYYVVKCFRADENGSPHTPDELPYDLIPISKSLDIWFFGTLMFELVTGESLLHSNKARNIVNDTDFERLFNWTMTDYTSSRRLSDIDNPLGRDLLRTLLTSPFMQRQRNMETILHHPFFSDEEGEAQKKVCKEIVQEEKEEARKYKIEQDLKLRKSTLDKRTENLSLISLETQLRFEQSQWKLLKSTYDLSEVTFPTSCIVLPYELEMAAGDLRVPIRNTALAYKMGLIISDILRYLFLVTDIKKKWTGQSMGYKADEYINMNRNATSAPEDNLIRICEGVIRKSKNATSIVSDVIVDYLSSGSKDDADSVAHKLISDTLRDIVDLDVCDKVVSNAEVAQASILSLLETIGEYPERAAENMMNEQMREIIGVDFTENSFAKKESVQNALMATVQQTAENPLSVMEGLLESRICELIDLYTEMEECYVYLIDEYSGLPVASGSYSIQLSFSSDIAKTLIPPTLLAMKANFPLGVIPLLGLTSEGLPSQWAKLAEFQLPPITYSPAEEIEVLQGALGIDREVGILSLLERFYMKNDPQEDFAGLRRLRSPNGLMIWVTKKSRQEALKQAKYALIELQERTAITAKETLVNATNETGGRGVDTLWREVGAFFPPPKVSHIEVSPKSPQVRSSSNNKSRWNSSKDVDKEQSNTEMRNDIQKKLNKLKGLQGWKPSVKRTDSSSVTHKPTNRLNGQRPELSKTSTGYPIKQTGHSRKPANESNKQKRNIAAEDNIDVNDYQGKGYEKDSDPRSIHDHRTIVFESPPNSEHSMESHMLNGDSQVGTESDATTRDENKDTGNTAHDVGEKTKMKLRNAEKNGEGSGNIQVGLLQPVKSDISESYVNGQWSPVHSDDDEPTPRPEDNRPKSASSDRSKVQQQQSTTVAPRMFRRVRQTSPKLDTFDNQDDDMSSVASASVSTKVSKMNPRLRPKAGQKTIGRSKRNITPGGGGSVAGHRNSNILSVNSFLAPNKNQQRMHNMTKGPQGPRMANANPGFESDDADSYFRAPRSRFDRVEKVRRSPQLDP